MRKHGIKKAALAITALSVLAAGGCGESKPVTTASTTAAVTTEAAGTTEVAGTTEAADTTEQKGDEDMLTGKWCDINGDAVLEFDGTKMYATWWSGQTERDEYNIKYEQDDYGTKEIKNANKDEYSFGIMSNLEICDDGTLRAYEEILDGEGHSYRFVPEEKAEEEKAVKDLSEDAPKVIESKDIKAFSLSLRHYTPEGLDYGNYSWELKKLDEGGYQSDFTGMGSDYVIINDTTTVDDAFVQGLQAMMDEDKLAEKNGMFFSHNESDTEYSLYVRYESGERLSLKVGSKALDKWFVDSERYLDYARSVIKEEE